MLFSVIIPVYNVAPYLRACLDSVIASVEYLEKNNTTVQPSTEIICIDDGSTDGSGTILDEYAEKVRNSAIPNSSFLLPRFLVVHQPNRGVSAARNAALKIAKGDYVCFVDADDLVEPNWLREYKQAIDESGADLIRCGGVRGGIDDENLRCWLWSDFVADGYPWKYALKRKVAATAEFPTGVVMSEDAIYNARIVSEIHTCFCLGGMYYCHLEHPGSAMYRALPSDERLKYLLAWCAIADKIDGCGNNVERRVISHYVTDGILAWLMRPKDDKFSADIYDALRRLCCLRCADICHVRQLFRFPYWLYLHTGYDTVPKMFLRSVNALVAIKNLWRGDVV